MMLNSGMPELTSVNDLKYLRDTLALGMGETKALEYFEAKFHEARKGAWFTQADWLCHGVNVT
ncbi:unnamed protein product [Protopolystoma xenopodis]|uniref:Uncharacterized protein n=1 Tax=Protopolystoma xenopodis TaxID=117903 RepID=A0A3S5ASY2_9PLAT|nr:unnamed protein product [Protopolystoma xenopodis]